MPKLIRSHMVFHNDDLSLELTYPDEIKKYIGLDKETLVGDFEIFCRIFFNHILKPKDRREFRIQYNEEKDEWQYLYPVKPKDK